MPLRNKSYKRMYYKCLCGYFTKKVPSTASAVAQEIIATVCHHSNPKEIAMMPNVNYTERYPSPMGMPAHNPRVNCFVFLFLYYTYIINLAKLNASPNVLFKIISTYKCKTDIKCFRLGVLILSDTK